MNMLKTITLTLVCAVALIQPALAAQPLKFATQNAENAWSTVNGLLPWLEKIQAESMGTLKVDLYANQTLAKGNQAWMAVKNGIADMAWIPMGMYPGMNPFLEVVGMGGMNYADALQGTAKVWDVYEQVEVTQKPFQANKILALFTTDTAFLITKKPIHNLEDMKGMKIRCTAGAYVNWLTALGASPVVMAMPDVYMALQKGTIDGLIGDWESFVGFRFYDVARYITTNIPIGSALFSISMNTNKFKALPPEAQKAIEQNSYRSGSLWLAEHFSYNSRELGTEVLAKKQAEIIELSPEEKARWTALVGQPLWDTWLEAMTKKGHTEAAEVLTIMSKP